MAIGPPEATYRVSLRSACASDTGLAPAASRRVFAVQDSPRKHHGIELLDAPARLLVSRFSYGITPGLAEQVRAAGGAREWWEQQLIPTSVRDSFADELASWWPTLNASPRELWDLDRSGAMRAFGVSQDYQRYVLARRIFSHRQVLEVMTGLWEDLLDVPLDGGQQYLFRRAYGETLRANAFGSYEDILLAAITHPAMLVHRENLGRRLLEQLTVGIGVFGGADLEDAARVLAGWRVDLPQGERPATWAVSYDPEDHRAGPVRVLDFTDTEPGADGRATTRRLVGYLARHRATARRVVTRLVTRFVCDDAPPALVERLVHVYLANDTAVVPVLRAMIGSPEFLASKGAKGRDTTEDTVATWRVLGAQLRRPTSSTSAANELLWQADDVASIDVHHAMAGRWSPSATQGMVSRAPQTWLPPLPVRLDQLVDHLSQQLLHQHASIYLVRTCCQAVGYDMDQEITTTHPVATSGIPVLLGTILDSSDFLLR
jgi:hypothetical protein